ncbi:sugar phosphate nucleotidyltransferase [Brevundimonas sp. 2P06AA]|uniref:sugar phosphate nucleotidyltransferase n=2 Tax=unclassified Brevundimonas TaxID=2622653 RepID=UPI0039A040E9
MTFYPVIMCGGAGTRLWPASRPSRPKQFIPLAGNRSLFQETALRVVTLIQGGGRILVVGGAAHRGAILDQLHEVGVEAQILLEPEARDSAPAMAAAAAWTHAHDPLGINVFVASDHHIPDAEAFRSAVRQAAILAQEGHIVTLGVEPSEPSEAYGYIRAKGAALGPVEAFVEKPDRRTAETYIERGYLWNSGNFIASAETFLAELSKHSPGAEAAARAAVSEAPPNAVTLLGPSFREAPRVSIDYALMEKTRNAWVLPVDFAWSDLGSWDAVSATGEGEIGGHIFEDAEGCMARASDGMIVAALGVRNLAIVAERDAVLVCDLSRAQDVKKVVERIRLSSPHHVDFPQARQDSLLEGMERLRDWLRLRALPVWSAIGQSENGAFAELVSLEARPLAVATSLVTQARQVTVFVQAGRLGWRGPWRRNVEAGLAYLDATMLCSREEGDECASSDDPVIEGAALLLAWAAVQHLDGVEDDYESRSIDLMERLLRDGAAEGAFDRIAGIFEAALAWADVGSDPSWRDTADTLAATAIERLLEPGEALRLSDEGRGLSPGVGFEWASLLAVHGGGGSVASRAAAGLLYTHARESVDLRSGFVLDAKSQQNGAGARRAYRDSQLLWLKAALVMGNSPGSEDGEERGDDARQALHAVFQYLTDHGLWRDVRLEDGRFIGEAVSARSLRLLHSAFEQAVRILSSRTVGKLQLGLH